MTNFNEGLHGNRNFSSDEERRDRYNSGDYERREGSGWYGDSERRSGAAERDWESRGGSRGSSRRGGRSRYEDDDNDRGGRSERRGWVGDSEGHSQAAGRGWEGRGRGRSRDD